MKTPNADKIFQLKREIAELQKADSFFLAMTHEEKLADELHTMLCRHNHTDGCGWHYEIRGGNHDWNGSSHEPYLIKARSVMTFCKNYHLEPQNAINLIKLVSP